MYSSRTVYDQCLKDCVEAMDLAKHTFLKKFMNTLVIPRNFSKINHSIHIFTLGSF